ncbi:hypothetical protein [Roseibium sp. Sym1]|nr:hypothetical protein [Roseibium sp. Sym1]
MVFKVVPALNAGVRSGALSRIFVDRATDTGVPARRMEAEA